MRIVKLERLIEARQKNKNKKQNKTQNNNNNKTKLISGVLEIRLTYNLVSRLLTTNKYLLNILSCTFLWSHLIVMMSNKANSGTHDLIQNCQYNWCYISQTRAWISQSDRWWHGAFPPGDSKGAKTHGYRECIFFLSLNFHLYLLSTFNFILSTPSF